MTYKFVPRNGHVELYIDGKFYCSADTMAEAVKEMEQYAGDKN